MENETELVKTIKLLTGLLIEERTAMGKKGREYALKEKNYASLAEKFLNAVESC